MERKKLIKTTFSIFLIIILSSFAPSLSAVKEQKIQQDNSSSLFLSNETFFFCKINTTGNAKVVGSLSNFPGIGGELKLFGATLLIDVTYKGGESFGNTTIKPFFGLSPKNTYLNGSHKLNIWCLWGDTQVPPVGSVGETHIEGLALLVKVL